MKKLQVRELLESLYDFCGTFDTLLKSQYKRSKIANEGVSFPQFCLVMYEQFMQEANALNLLTPKKKSNAKQSRSITK
jgi:hypothetical protein|tara:strand:- start:162 stop:395 length:234 start_codon:yes stop_codon:yes gene_type:complete